MPHISKKRLSEITEKAIESRLIELIRQIGKNKYSSHALKELLTPTESLMLSKRFAMIYLVNKGKSTLDICDTLNVSTSTVAKIEKMYDRGAYKQIEKVINELEPTMLDLIEVFLSAGMPPIVGKGRLKHITG